MKVKTICGLTMLCIGSTIWAQTNLTQWHSIGPLGGDINEIIETDSGALIAGTRLGGLYRSNDKGANWSSIPETTGAPLLFVGIWDLIKNSQGHLFAATNRGIYRSTDDGATWTHFDQGFVNRFVEALAVNSIDVLFAGTRSGVFRSEDNGETWVEFNNGLTNTFVTAVVVNSLGDVFAGTQSGVFFSDDNGDNWTERSNGFPGPTQIATLFVTPDDSLYAGTFNSGFRSEDHGLNWKQVLTIGTTLSFARNSSNLLVAGPAGSRISRSTDNGVTWTTAAGFQNLAGYKDLHFLTDTDLLAATARYGMLLSTDNGDSWTEANSGLYATDILALDQTPGGDILAGTGFGPFRSSDGGATWTSIATPEFNGNTRFIASNSSGRIFAEISGRLAISDDVGASWTEADSSFASSTRPESIAFGGGDEVYVGLRGHVFKSIDNGDTWVEFTNGLPGSDIQAMAVSSAGSLFAGTEGSGVFRSTTAGSTWVVANTGLPGNFEVSGFVLQPAGDIFVSGVGGVYRSANNGDTWVETASSFFDIRAFAGSPSGDLYIGGRGNGVAVSEDNGESWVTLNNGLSHQDAQALLIENTSTLYAGTRGGGVFKAEFVPTAVEEEQAELPKTFSLAQNYPNPFNPATVIRFALPQASQVKLSIYSIRGQLVRTLVSRTMEAGHHMMTWDGRNASGLRVATGLYLYRLRVNESVATKKMLFVK